MCLNEMWDKIPPVYIHGSLVTKTKNKIEKIEVMKKRKIKALFMNNRSLVNVSVYQLTRFNDMKSNRLSVCLPYTF